MACLLPQFKLVMAAQFVRLLFWLAVSVSCKAAAAARKCSVVLVYQYEDAVWVENLAVRPNRWILPATATSAVLMQLNPVNGEQQVLHDWSKFHYEHYRYSARRVPSQHDVPFYQ